MSPTLPEDAGRPLRTALGRFATGVTVVTAIDPDGHPIGLTVNSFAAVSLTPPLVLWSLHNDSHNFPAFKAVRHYCVNVLAVDQEDISNRFATWPIDRFANLAWQPGLGGAPVLAGCCAWFEVANQSQVPAGDHHTFFGLIERYTTDLERLPLIFHGGKYARLDAS